MVDKERVARLLERISADCRYLRRLATRSPSELIANETELRAIKYAFVTVIEGCARVAHHLSVSEGWSAPETGADAFRELGRHGVLATNLADELARSAGFRNVLVHQYTDVEDVRVVTYLQRVDDFEAFATSVARWLETQPAS